MRDLLVDCDRERFVVVCLDTKNQPTAINICHVGSLNASIVHPREIMKAAILANSASMRISNVRHHSWTFLKICFHGMNTMKEVLWR
ncbi:JAB domain-containing protein [Peribacillus acanthi]|uniref:JAB domain-containing protein n=1 Tax=Peribacillus acanthi TaxID=2171554 RepID=UPI003B83079A